MAKLKKFCLCKDPFTLDDNDAHFSIFFVVRNEKKKWVAWSPMIPFTLDDKKNNVVVVRCERAIKSEFIIVKECVTQKNIICIEEKKKKKHLRWHE